MVELRVGHYYIYDAIREKGNRDFAFYYVIFKVKKIAYVENSNTKIIATYYDIQKKETLDWHLSQKFIDTYMHEVTEKDIIFELI